MCVSARFAPAMSSSLSAEILADLLGGVGTLSAWALVRRFGLRTLYLAGQTAMLALLVTMGILGFVTSRSDPKASWSVASILLLYALVFNLTVVSKTSCFRFGLRADSSFRL